jgi:stearoyl-CoA desaturase (delta-9 desaturase)
MTVGELRAALADLQNRASGRLAEMQLQAQEAMAQWQIPALLPVLPSREELTEKAAAMFVRTPSLDAIAARAHDLLVEAMHARLVAAEAAPARHA